MKEIDFSVDIHCHPNLKPMGQSFKFDPFFQDLDPDHETSLWHYDPPSTIDKLLNELSLTKFSQANMTAAYYG